MKEKLQIYNIFAVDFFKLLLQGLGVIFQSFVKLLTCSFFLALKDHNYVPGEK